MSVIVVAASLSALAGLVAGRRLGPATLALGSLSAAVAAVTIASPALAPGLQLAVAAAAAFQLAAFTAMTIRHLDGPRQARRPVPVRRAVRR
jgi:hypothetical protein